MTLICECGSHAIEIVEQNYPTDDQGNPDGLAFEKYECAHCGRTGGFRFGERNGQHIERTSGCVTTDFEQ